jgi:hypothetical protein
LACNPPTALLFAQKSDCVTISKYDDTASRQRCRLHNPHPNTSRAIHNSGMKDEARRIAANIAKLPRVQKR